MSSKNHRRKGKYLIIKELCVWKIRESFLLVTVWYIKDFAGNYVVTQMQTSASIQTD